MGTHTLDQMLKVSKAALAAQKNLGKTVDYARPDVLDQAAETLKKNRTAELKLFGVKNTGQISWRDVETLTAQGYLLHTIDKMAAGGRAIDTDLINPLTGGVMTGSSSGSCVNILLGINDFALGTDGGGSVLGPAVSTGLYSIMGKGLGLRGRRPRTSTDGIEFTPGVGVISYDYDLCLQAVGHLAAFDVLTEEEIKARQITVAVSRRDWATDALQLVLERLDRIVQFVEADFHGPAIGAEKRETLISRCEKVLATQADLIISLEGPVDVWGRGDSVLGTWGETGRKLQAASGKGLLKVANMLNATAVSMPTGELATGIVIIGKEGKPGASICLSLAKLLQGLFAPPQLFMDYFIHRYRRGEEGLI